MYNCICGYALGVRMALLEGGRNHRKRKHKNMKHPLVAWITLGLTLSAIDTAVSAQAEQKDAARLWGSLEYLYMTRKGSGLPPLVTSSPPGHNGVMGTSPSILFGNERVNDDWNSGFRVTLGGWIDNEQKVGVIGRFFNLGDESQRFSMSSDAGGTPLLARPFHNADLNVNAEDALIVTSPGLRNGAVSDEASNHIFGGDLMLSYNWMSTENLRIDFVGGYQFTRIDDDLSMHSGMVEMGGVLPPDTRIAIGDKFDVQNDFHGIPVGLMIEFERGPWVISALGKIGLGAMHQSVSIHGSTSVTLPGGGTTTHSGGLFAQPTNSGTHTRNEFAWVPELGFSVGYQITPNCSVTLGYGAMYWSNVALAGNQVDRTVNSSQLMGGTPAGPRRPAASIHDTSYWVHGVQIGATFRF